MLSGYNGFGTSSFIFRTKTDRFNFFYLSILLSVGAKGVVWMFAETEEYFSRVPDVRFSMEAANSEFFLWNY